MSAHQVQEPPGVPSPAAGDDRTTERIAAHVGTTMRPTRATFRRCMADVPQLHHLAHYTQADWDFSVGPADEVDYALVGCNLVAALTRLSRLLAPAGTGALIRAVAHGDRGALVCNTIMQGEHVVGFAPDPASRHSLRDEPTRAADAAVAELVTELRAGFGQQSQNPGGYRAVATEDPFRWNPPAVGDSLQARIRAVLDPADLQYVAVLHDGELALVHDVFDDDAAEVFFRAGYSPATRRDFYARFLPTLEQHVRDIRGIINPAVGRGLRRLVLDVQRGAIYAYGLDQRTYLIGITLNQDRVALADLKTEWLSLPPHAAGP
jgi:hypothetical protein